MVPQTSLTCYLQGVSLERLDKVKPSVGLATLKTKRIVCCKYGMTMPGSNKNFRDFLAKARKEHSLRPFLAPRAATTRSAVGMAMAQAPPKKQRQKGANLIHQLSAGFFNCTAKWNWPRPQRLSTWSLRIGGYEKGIPAHGRIKEKTPSLGLADDEWSSLQLAIN